MPSSGVEAGSIPPREVTEQFAVRVVSPLGGRANRQWLVLSGNTRLVLRRYAQQPLGDLSYELRVMDRLDRLGWPVPAPVAPPITVGGRLWCLLKWLQGTHEVMMTQREEQRRRGRLLARLHDDLESLGDMGQRHGFCRAEDVVANRELTQQLREYERFCPDEARIMRWHADRAHECFASLDLENSGPMVLHGDFVSWNLLYVGDELTGILDFEATHLNHRVSDFALSWRGKHDEVIAGYEEVRPLDEMDWALLTPTFWSWLLQGVASDLRQINTGSIPAHGFEWVVRHLLRRSPLMGRGNTACRSSNSVRATTPIGSRSARPS